MTWRTKEDIRVGEGLEIHPGNVGRGSQGSVSYGAGRRA